VAGCRESDDHGALGRRCYPSFKKFAPLSVQSVNYSQVRVRFNLPMANLVFVVEMVPYSNSAPCIGHCDSTMVRSAKRRGGVIIAMNVHELEE